MVLHLKFLVYWFLAYWCQMVMASRRVELCSVASLVFLAFLSTYCHLNQRHITGVCLPSDQRLSALFCQHYKPLSSFNRISRRSNGAITNPAIRSLRRFNKPNWFCFGLLLLCGDIISQPGLTTENTTKKTSLKGLLINTQSLTSMNPTGIGNGKSWNLHRFQDLVYSECADIVFVSETRLTGNILDTELLGQDYTIIRKDRIARRGGGVLIAVKSSLFRSVKEFSTPASSDLELISVEAESALSQKILFCSCYRTKEADEKWMDSFKNFLNVSCSKFDTMLMCGDLNFPKISWDPSQHLLGANEQSFVDILNDHFLTQLNTIRTRGNNILDLVITSVPDQVNVTEVVKAIDADMATDHAIVSFEFQISLTAPPKMNRFIFDYNKGDFKELRSSLQAANLSNLISPDTADINNDWRCWKDAVLAAMADFIPKKKLKGSNPLPWINGSIINLIKKKDSIRKKLKQRPSSVLSEKFRSLFFADMDQTI